MTTLQSSIAIAAELQALLTAMSSAAQLVIRDSAGNALATATLPDPPATAFNSSLVLLGAPTSIQVSSGAPVGSTPATADILNVSGNPIITGLTVMVPSNFLVLASSTVAPGGSIGFVGGSVSIP